MIDGDRIPPSSIEAEMALLGSILVDRGMLDVVAAIVRPGDFYAHVHESLFAAILDLDEARKPIDKLTLAGHLRDRQRLENLGGFAYLTRLMDTVPTAASAEYYAEIVREKAQLRALISAGGALAKLGFEGEIDVNLAVAQAETVFQNALDSGKKNVGGRPVRRALISNYERLNERVHGDVRSEGQLTPWKGVNDRIGPLMPGEMVVWAAAAKMGKTAAITMLADFVAAHYGQVAAFVLEMGVPAMAMRYAALYSGVSARQQRSGDLTEFDLQRISAGSSQLFDRPIELYDLTSVPRLADMRRELRLLAKRGPIAAIVVDHGNFLGDVDAAKYDRSNKSERLDFVYRTLLRFAKEFGCVVHAVQHVNREGMKGRPELKDIRDGGNPEGHAHAVVAPFRPKPIGTADERRQGEFIILAAREGDAGVAPMQLIGHRGLWLDEGTDRAWFEPKPVEELDFFAEAMA